MNRIFASLILVCAIFLFSPLAASAAPITVPGGLHPGDHYRLAFVTSTTRDATSSDIEDYNAFVTVVANSVPELAALGTTWQAIASTPNVDARDNTGTNPDHGDLGVPVFSLGDTQVAWDNFVLWGGIFHPVNFTEAGLILGPDPVWTGTIADGTYHLSHALGNRFPVTGDPTSSSGEWMFNPYFGTPSFAIAHHFYAMSGVLTVVPEPGTIVLACLAAAGLAASSVRRRRPRSS